ncbi:DUF1783-domain-containing protein [Trametopsis cervina]|nr:DUF1783-domain-containing protein [Trametopsis cervina]
MSTRAFSRALLSATGASAAAVRTSSRLRCRTLASAPGGATSSATKPPPTSLPEGVTYSEPSKPREYYTRPQRDLPPLQRSWPIIVAVSVLGVSAWSAFYWFASNQERLASSVLRQIMGTIREHPALEEALGHTIRFEPAWWLNGDPVIHGAIHLMQGNVDLSFRIKGHKGAGTLYFTSIRRVKGEPFTILRFRVICDDGQIVEIPFGSFTA